MSYKVELLPGKPVVLTTIFSDGLWLQDLARSEVESRRLLEQARGPLFVVIDLKSLTFSLEQVMMGINMFARNERLVGRHPNQREMLIVSYSSLVKYAFKGPNAASGNLNARAFGSLEQALDYVHSQVAV